jgi:hypothetical protein
MVNARIVSRVNWSSRAVSAFALGLCLSLGAQAQQSDPSQQQTDQQRPDQRQQQQDQSPQQSPPSQAPQPSAQPDQAPAPPPPDQQQAPPPDSRPKPKYAPQDADKPPYASDYPQQGGPRAHAPSPDQYDPDQDQAPQDGATPNSPRNGQPPYDPRYDQQNGQQQNAPRQDGGYRNAPRAPRANVPVQPPPATLTIPAGTIISVRINEYLSSDRNQVGDRVTATLQSPMVASGWVVARRGQTLTGQVEVAQKAGRVKGTSQLGIELTNLTLVDGQQRPILTELWKASAGTSHGADAATIGGTTALGAAIGAAADWGRGAAIGAGAGAAAGIGAVLLTRGRPTIIEPETQLSFRLVDPVTVDTTQSQQAFVPVGQQDYDNGRGYRGNGRYAGGYSQPGPYAPAPACGYYDSCYAYPGYLYPGYAYYPGYYYPYVGFGWGWGWGGRYYGGFGRGFRR